MVRQTSISAYRTIEENGLLSKRRWQVYQYLYLHGPATARKTVKALTSEMGNVSLSFSSLAARFCELRRLGLIQEIGKVLDPDTGMLVLNYDVTDNLPKKIKKEKRIKCEHCNGKGYTLT